jgi:hypothetical protein
MVADASALAGAKEISYCGGTSNCSALTTAAQDGLTENGFAGSTLVTSCAGSTGKLSIMVNNPPCFLGAADPHQGNANYVETVVAAKIPVFFARIFGYTSVSVTARGEAALGSSSNCLYTLDPTDSGAVNVNNGSALQLPACSMYVNSISTSAVTVSGGSKITASSIDIVGGDSVTNGGSISPTPTTGVAAAVDPLAYLPKPTVGTCTTTGLDTLSDVTKTLSPGTYCGGISITNASNITFATGTYVLDGGGINITGGSTVTGSNVTFFLTGTITYPYGPVSISNGATVTLIAPTSGTYVGILFYQDPTAYGATSSSASSFAGVTGSIFQGALYFPTTPIVYSGGSSSQYTIIDVYSITISGGAVLNSDYSSLAGGSPIKGAGAMLVE